MVCELRGSTHVTRVYPKGLGDKMVQQMHKKSIDLYLEPEDFRNLKALLAKVSEDRVLHLILVDLTRGPNRIQLMVEECTQIPESR